jgi:hypothetical protein
MNAEIPVLEREKKYFRTIVELMRLSNSKAHFYNHFPWEARIVVQNILAFAEETGEPLKIFASGFYEFYYGEIYDKLVELGRNGHDIQIILAEHPDESDLPKWEAFGGQSNVSLRYMLEYDATLNHVWLAGTAYRYELPHPRFTEKATDTYPEVPARFAFHNNDEIGKAKQAWNKAFFECKHEVLLPRNLGENS